MSQVQLQECMKVHYSLQLDMPWSKLPEQPHLLTYIVLVIALPGCTCTIDESVMHLGLRPLMLFTPAAAAKALEGYETQITYTH